MNPVRLLSLVLACSSVVASAATYDSATSGIWNGGNTGTWTPNGNPQTGAGDIVNILTGHTIVWDQGGVGVPGSGDLGTANGGIININGGSLSQNPTFFWIRIGQQSLGTMNINDGRFNFANVQSTDGPNMQIGIQGGTGIVNIGDGLGTAGSAIFNLRDLANGTEGTANINLNLSADEGGPFSNQTGTIVINSDGLLEGGKGVTRIAQAATTSHALSSVTVNAGGQWRVHGTLEVASQTANGGANRSNGLITLTGTSTTEGTGGRIDQDRGEFVVGWNGDGALTITNGGTYSKVNTPGARGDIFLGRNTTGIGTVTVENGGRLLRGSGGEVADLRIGFNGTGIMNINNGGLVENRAGNWDWIGENNGSNGTLNINTGGIFRTVEQTNFNIGVNGGATGLVVVNGGLLDLQNIDGGAEMRIGQNGTGTFRMISGTTNVRSLLTAQGNGNANIDIQGGTLNVRVQAYLGGDNGAAATGTGSTTVNQSGGTVNIGASFVLGLGSGHNVTYTMTGGTVMQTGGDMSVGESGTATMTVGSLATVTNITGGVLYIGRNNGSSGSLIVNGSFSKAAGAVRVGNGNDGGTDNTDAPGTLGGTGTFSSSNVRIGLHGTLTGGTLSTVGNLTLNSNVSFSTGGTLFANIDSSGNADRITLNGTADITGATLSGTWAGGGPTGVNSRYWLVVNDGSDSVTGTFGNTSPVSLLGANFPDANGWVTFSGQEFAIFYNADFDTNALTGGNDILLSAVPEPASVGLLAGAVGLMGAFRRRSRRA